MGFRHHDLASKSVKGNRSRRQNKGISLFAKKQERWTRRHPFADLFKTVFLDYRNNPKAEITSCFATGTVGSLEQRYCMADVGTSCYWNSTIQINV
jgi:hypothetical protein